MQNISFVKMIRVFQLKDLVAFEPKILDIMKVHSKNSELKAALENIEIVAEIDELTNQITISEIKRTSRRSRKNNSIIKSKKPL